MKHVLMQGLNSLFLFAFLFSLAPSSPGGTSLAEGSHNTHPLSVVEMSSTIGGEVNVTIQASPSAWYGIIGGSLIGYAVSGATGVLPGALIGALVWIFIIGG